MLPLWQHLAPAHPIPPHWPHLAAQGAELVGCVPGALVLVVLVVRVVPTVLVVEELLDGFPPETAALKNAHVSPGANLTPPVPDGSGTWPPPCAIQVTAAREQLYVVLRLACCPAEGSGAFCAAQPLVCSHLSRSWRPSAMGSTSSAAPWIPR